MDRQKTVGNSLGRLGKAPLGGSEHAAWMDRKPWKYIAWGELRWEGARLQLGRGGIEHAAWTDRKPLEVAWGTPRWERASMRCGAPLGGGDSKMQSCWHGFFKTNPINGKDF